MSTINNGSTPDRHEAFNRLTPHSAALSFDLQVALSNYLSAIEQIGPSATIEQIQPLEHDLNQESLRAVLRAVSALEQEIVKIRHGVTDEDLADLE